MAANLLPLVALAALAAAAPMRARAQTFTTLYNFKGGSDADTPNSTLVVAGGALYGTSTAGGAAGNGTVFRVDAATGAERVVHGFAGGGEGGSPEGSVFLRNGALYGTTSQGGGGGGGGGVAFAVDVSTGVERVLHVFENRTGVVPQGGLILSHGAAFGTTRYGGPSQLGTVDRIDLASGAYTVLADLAKVDAGSEPSDPVTAHGGVLYGTTQGGGTGGFGLVFALDVATRKETVLHSFQSADGNYPTSGVVYANGLLYGATPSGGVSGDGTIYRIDAATGEYTLLYNLTSADGSNPVAGLTLDNGVLYGETTAGGPGGGGTVFAYRLADNSERVVHGFTPSAGGSVPTGGLTAQAHILYGTTSSGGDFGVGTVFKLVP